MGECLIRNRARSKLPRFTFTGTYQQHDDGGGNWRIKFLSSGTLRFLSNTGISNGLDAFLVGGGGTSAYNAYGHVVGNGGSGYTRTVKNVAVERDVDYEIVVGKAKNSSTAFGFAAAPGGNGTTSYFAPTDTYNGQGGSGGSGGSSSTNSVGGKDGGNGNGSSGGKGQKAKAGPNGETGSTREFGEPTGDLYSTGGGKGTTNLPNSGDGGWRSAASGQAKYNHPAASGIVIIRNAR